MSTLLIKNARAVLPGQVMERASLLVEEGRIRWIGEWSEPPVEAQILDVQGNYLMAGFVDLHVHGGGNADFMDGSCAAFERVVKAHLAHGTTTLLPTAMTASEADLGEFLRIFKEFRRESVYGCITPGVHLEGPYFSGANAKSSGAQPSDFLRLPDMEEVERLLAIADGDILRWDAAPELEGADIFAQRMQAEGILCSMAHSAASSEEAQRGIDHGFSHVTHCYNAITTYHKTGQTVYAGAVEAAYLNDTVSLELICDGKHIPRDILRVALRFKGPDKVMAITDAMRLAATDRKAGRLGSLKNGTDVIVDDGVAKLPDRSSYAGSIATMERCLIVLCKTYGIPVLVASQLLSATPARVIGLGDRKGTLEVGKDADLVIVSPDFTVEKVLLNGILL